MALLDILDEKILILFQLQGDGVAEFIVDTGSSCVQILLILWAYSLGKKAVLKYKENEKHYRKLIELSPEAIFVHRKGKILFTNKAGLNLLGAHSMSDLLNHNWKEYIQFSTGEEQRIVEKLKNNKNRIVDFQIKAKKLDGQEIDLEITATDIDYNGVLAREFIARDITKRKEQEGFIKQLAYQDTLTKLPNRRAFLDQLDHLLWISKVGESNFALMFIDLDGFKKVNDTLGHDIGDDLLKKVSDLLKESIRSDDFVARLAGDEFTILLPNANESVCRFIANKIIKVLNVPIHITKNEIKVTSSIGISLYPQNGEDATVLIKKADEAMYQAKNNGKNGYKFAGTSEEIVKGGI